MVVVLWIDDDECLRAEFIEKFDDVGIEHADAA
jgi:hypothetical protein